LFCRLLALTFVFNGMMFIANASFNNLGKPKYSTWFNMGKATLGTIPFVLVGAEIAGVKGILIGQALGSVFFGIASIMLAFRLIKQKECKTHRDSELADKLAEVATTSTVNALSSECSQFGMYSEECDSKGCNLLLDENDNNS